MNRQLQYIIDFLRTWHPSNAKKALILYGPPGVGKTYTVYEVARMLGYRVVEYNASDSRRREDMKTIYARVCTSSMYPTIFLLDEADGIEDKQTLRKIVKNCKNPVILTCNDITKLQSIRTYCAELRFYYPDAQSLAQASRGGRKILVDYRQASMIYTEGYVPDDDLFKKLEIEVKSGRYDARYDARSMILLDSCFNMFHGARLILFLRMLQVADYAKRLDLLDGFRHVNPRFESYFFKKLKRVREHADSS